MGLKIPTLALVTIGCVWTIGKVGWEGDTDEFWVDVWEEGGEGGVLICGKEWEFGIELADAYSPDIVNASSPGKEIHNSWAFYGTTGTYGGIGGWCVELLS